MSHPIRGLIVFLWFLSPALLVSQAASSEPTEEYSLTARPWEPVKIDRQATLATLESLCRFSVRHQANDGAIIDPFLHREVQYATPYFAYAVGTLVKAGKARDLLPRGVAAMEHSTFQFAAGRSLIPDQHAEFFIAALAESLDVYEHLVQASQFALWRSRLAAPISSLVGPNRNNWMTYSMKGEWLRYRHGLVSREEAVQFIESSWNEEQRDRIAPTKFHLYHDRSSDPDTLSVETVGRGNLLALVEAGYDGPSAAAIRSAVDDGTRTSLFLEDPSGQLPANGRTDDHVWPDIGQALAFQVMANREWREGHTNQAMAFQHGAFLAVREIQRWRRSDGAWAGSYSITKNHFDPTLRVGYQDASHFSNYTGSLMFHLAELLNLEDLHIRQRPAPSEIGGYALALDSSFDSVIADAGGMQVQMNLRGQTEKSNGNFWTPLGIVRFARDGWDTRLGPSDGALTADSGVTFAPEFLENGAWHRLADLSTRYRAEWTPEFVHPALVRGVLSWRPLPGSTGPEFQTRLWITPDGVYTETTKTSPDPVQWGMTWPLLVNDGQDLATVIDKSIASTSYPGGGDQESFLAVDSLATIETNVPTVRSSYGDLRALRVVTPGPANRSFVYPHNSGQLAATEVQQTMRRTEGGWVSTLGRVEDNIYVGRTAAGGVGRELRLQAGARPALTFAQPCGFFAQIRKGKVVAVETDRDVEGHLGHRTVDFKAHHPVHF